jgi:hypothetical protein
LKEIKEPFEKAEAETSDDAKCTHLFQEMFNPQSKIKKVKPYSDLGRQALAFAKEKLNIKKDTTPFKFEKHRDPHFLQPKNQEIALLTTLYFDTVSKLQKLCQEHQNSLTNQEEIGLADELIKISYAISNLTLDELELFTKKDLNRCQVLKSQTSYHYYTFFYCTTVYHWIRGMYDSPADDFYREGTVQNSWNQLYNNYCERRQLYFEGSELEEKDKRYTKWTQKDTTPASFKRKPDYLPT